MTSWSVPEGVLIGVISKFLSILKNSQIESLLDLSIIVMDAVVKTRENISSENLYTFTDQPLEDINSLSDLLDGRLTHSKGTNWVTTPFS